MTSRRYAEEEALPIYLENVQHPVVEEPPVNASSRVLKALAGLHQDWYQNIGFIRVEFGIGDCNTGVSAILVQQVLERKAINHNGVLHFPYGDMRSSGSYLNRARDYWLKVHGAEARDYMTITGAGRGSVFFGMKAFEAMMREADKTTYGIIVTTWGTYTTSLPSSSTVVTSFPHAQTGSRKPRSWTGGSSTIPTWSCSSSAIR